VEEPERESEEGFLDRSSEESQRPIQEGLRRLVQVKWRRCALNVDTSVDLIIFIAMGVNQ